jgi:sugar phosphate isomerase/epimerase
LPVSCGSACDEVPEKPAIGEQDMKRIAMGSWAYAIGPYADCPIDFETVCRKVRDLGFDGLELGAFAPHPNPNGLPAKSQRNELRAKMKEWGLEFAGMGADLWGQRLLNTDDPGPYLAEFTKSADFCADLGMVNLRLDTVQPPTIFESVDYSTALARLARAWKTCCGIAADRGLRVSWEFEPGFAFNKPSDILRVLDAVDEPNFGVLLDTCHAQMVSVVGARQPGKPETLPGGPVELIRMLHGRINHLHLIDSDNTCHKDAQGNDETSAHPPFGLGVLDFDQIMPALAAERLPDDWWTIDLCFWANAWEATAQCKRFIDDLNRRYG